jgi:hypothetical protein
MLLIVQTVRALWRAEGYNRIVGKKSFSLWQGAVRKGNASGAHIDGKSRPEGHAADAGGG